MALDLYHPKFRANINRHELLGKDLFIYEDHRSLVYILWHAMRFAETLKQPPLLIYFDGHDDALSPSDDALSKLRNIRDNPSQLSKEQLARELYSTIEFDLLPRDDDWLLAAMELGVVGDAIRIGDVIHGGNIDKLKGSYTDGSGTQHRMWDCQHIVDMLGDRGSLGDRWKGNQYQELWNVLGWDTSQNRYVLNDDNGLPPIVLDFDLDCFTGAACGQTTAWDRRHFEKKFKKHADCEETSHYTASGFLRALEDRVAFRTIALESGCCGGIVNSLTILENLDRCLWNSELADAFVL